MVDAYQALIMALAYDNKTPNISPTIYNNQRILSKGINSTSDLYEVFMAGVHPYYEVYFRKSTNGGTDWCTPVRLSIGNEENRYPCITVTDEGSSDGVHVIWQKKKDNGKWMVYYSKSTTGGGAWQVEADTLADDLTCSGYQQYGPMPVITCFSSSNKLIGVWATSGGLRYRVYASGSWGSAQSIDDGSYNNRVWRPSIMGVSYESGWAILTYDTRGCGVYSRTFNGSSWTSRTRVDLSSTSSDRASQVAVDYYEDTYATWFGYKSGSWYICYRKGTFNAWSSTYSEWGHTGTDSRLPAIAALSNQTQHIVYNTDDKKTRLRIQPSGTSTVLANDARYPNVFHAVTGSTKYIWPEDQSTTGPYDLIVSDQWTSKANTAYQEVYHRRIGIESEEEKSGIFLELGEIEAVTSEGEKVPLDFTPLGPNDDVELTSSNLMDYLEIAPSILPANVEKLQFYVEIFTGCQRDTLKPVKTGFKQFGVSFNLTDKAFGKSYSIVKNVSDNQGAIDYKETMSVNVSGLSQRKILFRPEITDFDLDDEKYTYSLGHIWIMQDAPVLKPVPSSDEALVPNRFLLHQNIPNPFNMETVIQYSIPRTGHVALKIYDLLGQEVRTLVDRETSAGNHRVTWDGKDKNGTVVPSGVYVYRLISGEHVEQRKMTVIK